MEIDEAEKIIALTGAKQPYADGMRATALSDDLKAYWVTNTANSDQLVIASLPKYARIISARSGHLRDAKNGRVVALKDSYFDQNPGFGSAIRRAIRDRRPGVIERKGEHAVLADKVYAPLSGV